MSVLEPERIEHFRELLKSTKSSAEALLQQTAGGAKIETSGSAIGRLTRMDAIQMQAMSQMSRQQLQVRLQQIDAALRAMERGTYGSCRNCDEPIGLARLEALPEAPFCVYCQEAVE
jgi:DnaK suppressor protein